MMHQNRFRRYFCCFCSPSKWTIVTWLFHRNLGLFHSDLECQLRIWYSQLQIYTYCPFWDKGTRSCNLFSSQLAWRFVRKGHWEQGLRFLASWCFLSFGYSGVVDICMRAGSACVFTLQQFLWPVTAIFPSSPAWACWHFGREVVLLASPSVRSVLTHISLQTGDCSLPEQPSERVCCKVFCSDTVCQEVWNPLLRR